MAWQESCDISKSESDSTTGSGGKPTDTLLSKPRFPRSHGNSQEKGLKKKLVRNLFIALGVCLLIALFWFRLPQKVGQSPDYRLQSSGVQKKIKTLEDRIAQLSERIADRKVAPISKNQALSPQISSLKGQIQKLEAKVGKMESELMRLSQAKPSATLPTTEKATLLYSQMNQLSKKVKALEKKVVAIKVPVKAAPQAQQQPRSYLYHKVRSGDTLYTIARRYGITINELRKFNGLGRNITIFPGQRLIVGYRR